MHSRQTSVSFSPTSVFQHLVVLPLFPPMQTPQTEEDRDVKWCLTNILLILISRPRAPGTTEVHFKAEPHIGISGTLFALACRANSLGISVCVVLVATVGGQCTREYKTVILSTHSRAINSMITHQSGCCVWLHNHWSKSHSHSAPSYQRGYCFNPLLCGSDWACGGFVPSWLIQPYLSNECRPITLNVFKLRGCNSHTHAYTQL